MPPVSAEMTAGTGINILKQEDIIMSRSHRLDILMRENVMKNEEKVNGRLSNEQTIKPYRRNIDKFCDWAEKECGIRRERDVTKKGYSYTSLIQKYADYLVAQGLKPTSVHTYLAPVCKGLGVGMEQISKPSRLSKDIVKNTKRHQNAAGARQAADPRNARIVRFAEVVTVRPRAMARLIADNLKVDENGDHIIVIRDKGGKESIQLILPHEVEFVRDTLTKDADGKPLQKGQRPFSTKDLKQIAFSKYRIERAQRIEAYFEKRFNGWINMPSRTPEQRKARNAARAQAQREKQEWVDKIVKKYAAAHPLATRTQIQQYRADLMRPSRIYIREGNKERALQLGRPTDYDRVAVRIASVYALSHWEDTSTIRNYLTK